MVANKPIRDLSDISEIESRGLGTLMPVATPYEILERGAHLWPEATAIQYLRAVDAPEQDAIINYGNLFKQVRQTANLFRRLGVGPEESVAILMPHVPIGQVALWAAETACRACPINPMLRPDHVIELLRASNSKVAVILGANDQLPVWENVVPALRASGAVETILSADADPGRLSEGGDGDLEDLIALEQGSVLDFPYEPESDAVAAMFHTGGTTGAPKLAVHTRGNQAFVAFAAARMYDLSSDDRIINGFPLFHVAGTFVYGLSALASGSTTLIPTRLGMRNTAFISSIWRQAERYDVTLIGAVPTIISSLNATECDHDISKLRALYTGGSPLPTDLADTFEEKFKRPVRNIFGMTECAGVVSIELFHGPRTPGSTGLALPFTRVKAFRLRDGNADLHAQCGPGETGALALKGPNVARGYTDTTRNPGTFEADGWLVSGDLGHVDDDGRIFVTGRAKDVIIRGAHNIDPAAIEDALLQHPAVALSAAIGRPDAYAGELPVAFVTLKPGTDVDTAAILEAAAPHIPEPAAVPKFVTIIEHMPITPVGKIYKPALRILATRAAVEDVLDQLGIAATQRSIDVTEKVVTITVSTADQEEQSRKALTGMPIDFEIVRLKQ